MSGIVHQLVAVAGEPYQGKYRIYYCACAADFSALADIRKHMAEANGAEADA